LKIVHLAATPYWSGPLENISLLALAQRAAGHDVQVLVDTHRQRAPSEELAVPRLNELALTGAGGEGPQLSNKSSPWAMFRDLRWFSRLQADVVHAHMSHDHFLARGAPSTRFVLVRSVHAPRSLRPSLPRADAYTVPFRDALVALGRAPAMVFPALHASTFQPPKDRAALRAELGLEGSPLIGMVSTFQASRRHHAGFHAFRQVLQTRPKARLVLVGDGPLDAKLRQEAIPLGGKVVFAGYQQGTRFTQWLQALDEVWILGLGNDWSARAAVQARACQVRVIAVREGALPDWADALCDPTPESIANASASGQRAAHELPSASAVASDMVDLYRQARGASPL